jgi:hypothetical protein
MQQLWFIIKNYLYMFGASISPSSGVQVECYCIWCSALGVVAVVPRSRCVVLCTQCWTPYAVAFHLYSWRWAYRCPKHVEIIFDNKSQLLHQVGTSCQFHTWCTVVHTSNLVAEVLTFLIVWEKYLVRMSALSILFVSLTQFLARLFPGCNRCGIHFFMKLPAKM